MKIVKEENNVMIINRGPYIIIAHIFGGIFFFAGLFFVLFPSLIKEKVPILMSIALIVFGAMAFFFTTYRTITLDKNEGKITIRDKGIARRKNFEYLISEIKGVCLKLQIRYDSVGERSRRGISTKRRMIRRELYWLELEKDSGNIELSFPGDGSKEVGLKIAEFLNLPFKEVKPEQSEQPTRVVSFIK